MIEVLNHYLSEMSDAILDHGGTLVAYMGDGIMAVFGAPMPRTTTPTVRWPRRARCSAPAPIQRVALRAGAWQRGFGWASG